MVAGINTELICNIIRYVMLAIDIIIIVLGIGYLGFGFLWGFRKNTRRMLSFVVPLLIFLPFIGLIAKLILNADISFILQTTEKVSIKDYAIDLIAQYIYGGNEVIADSSKIIELAEAIALSVIKLVVYLIALIVDVIIVAPLIRICGWIAYKTSSKEKKKPSLVSRFVGMGIGSIRYSILLFIVIIPLFGFISTASLAIDDVLEVANVIKYEGTTEEEVKVENTNLSSETIKLLEETNKALNKSLFKKIMGATVNQKTGVTFDSYYLGKMIEVKTSDAKVNLINEYGNLRRVFPLAKEVFEIKSDENGKLEFNADYKNLSKEDVDLLVDVIKNFDSIDVMLPIALEYGCYYIEEQGLDDEYGLDIESIKTIEINKDFDLLMESIGVLSKTFVQLEVDWNHPQEILLHENIDKTIQEFISTILQTQIVDEVVIPLGVDYLTNYLEDLNDPDLNELIPIITVNTVEVCLKNDIPTFIKLMQEAYQTQLKEYIDQMIEGEQTPKLELDMSDETMQKFIFDAVVDVLSLESIDGNQEIIIKVIVNKTYQENINIDDILYTEEGIKKIDWNSEPTILASAIVQAAIILEPFINGMEATTDNILKVFLEDRNKTEALIGKIAESDIVRLVVLEILPNIIEKQESIPAEIKELLAKDVLTKIQEKDAFVNQVLDIVDIVEAVYDLGIIDFENFSNQIITEEMLDQVDLIIDKILACAIIEGNEKQIFTLLINYTGLDKTLQENGIEIDYSAVTDWSSEINNLTKIITDFLGLMVDQYSIHDISSSDNMVNTIINLLLENRPQTNKVLESIANLEIIHSVIIELLPELLQKQESIPTELKELLTKEAFKKLENKEVFIAQLNLILDVVRDLRELGITDLENFDLLNISVEQKDTLKNIAINIFSCVLIEGNEERIIQILMDATSIETMLNECGITIDYQHVTNWKEESGRLIDILFAFIDIAGDGEFALDDLLSSEVTEEQINKVADLFQSFSESEIFNPLLYQIIDQIGYTIEITEEDKEAIEANTWRAEIIALLGVKGKAQSLLEQNDLTTLKGSDVEAIMLEASIGVIATKIVGTILTTALGPDGLNINPVDINGNPKYDFTKQEVMREQASSIGNLVDIANAVSSFNDATTDISSLTDAIKGLSSNELAQDFMGEIVGDSVDLSGVDFEQEANAIEIVYEKYQAAEDKENFELDAETVEAIKDSELAKAILGAMGIL